MGSRVPNQHRKNKRTLRLTYVCTIAKFRKICVKLDRMIRNHVQLIAQGIKLSCNMLELIPNVTILCSQYRSPVFVMCMSVTECFNLVPCYTSEHETAVIVIIAIPSSKYVNILMQFDKNVHAPDFHQ